MRYSSLEDFVKNNPSQPCSLAKRNYEIFKSRADGLTLQQIAIKYGITKRQIITILTEKVVKP